MTDENKSTDTNSPDYDLHNTLFQNEVSPDSLMGEFRGKPLFGIVMLTLLAHVVIIGVFSIGYISEKVFGEDTSGLKKEERLDVAVREATESLREIAKSHGLTPQELSDRFAKGGTNSIAPAAAKDGNASSSKAGGKDKPVGKSTTSNKTGAPDKPNPSDPDLKKTLNNKEVPDLPGLDPKDDDDLFKTNE